MLPYLERNRVGEGKNQTASSFAGLPGGSRPEGQSIKRIGTAGGSEMVGWGTFRSKEKADGINETRSKTNLRTRKKKFCVEWENACSLGECENRQKRPRGFEPAKKKVGDLPPIVFGHVKHWNHWEKGAFA